jgi:hypothetical protein
MFLAVLLLCTGPSAADCTAMVETRRLFTDKAVCEQYVEGYERYLSGPGDRTVARCIRLAVTEV